MKRGAHDALLSARDWENSQLESEELELERLQARVDVLRKNVALHKALIRDIDEALSEPVEAAS